MEHNGIFKVGAVGELGQLRFEANKAHRNGSNTAYNLSFGAVLKAANFLL